VKNSLGKQDIEVALDCFDEVGREAFLLEYGGGGAAKFFIDARGNRYDAKAVLVVARRRLGGQEALASEDVPSDEKNVAQP
jgi:hypothetical protein